MRRKFIPFLCLLVLLGGGAWAQGPASVIVFGTVSQAGAASVTIKTDADAVETFALSPTVVVIQNKPATLADIKANDFVASAAMRGVDGKLHSTELRIFPEAMRGVGEGQRPMNDPRNQTMTNATVSGTAIVNGSNTLRVTFPGGESELVVDPGVPVTRMERVGVDAVVTGARVRVQGTRGADGAVASRITLQ
jgi:hypothetical protein